MCSLLSPNIVSADEYTNQINDKVISNINKSWVIRFNSSIDSNSLSSNSVQIKDLSDGSSLPAVVTLGSDDHSAKINAPAQGYKLGHDYQITVDQNIKSSSGRSLKRKALMKFNVIDLSNSNYSATVDVVTSSVLPVLKQIMVNTTDIPQIKKFKIEGNDKIYSIEDKAVTALNGNTATIYFYGIDGVTVIGKGTVDVSKSNNDTKVTIKNAE